MCVSPELFKVKLVMWIERGNPFFVYDLANFKPVFSFHRLYISVNFFDSVFCFPEPARDYVLCCWAGQVISCVVQG